MDLPTHFAFGFAVGLVFTDNTQIAFLVSLGALMPDLDREYWFIPRRIFSNDQIHRAGLHNVFVMALLYLVSPYLSLGVFLHVLQDSFTTIKDRGVEWFFPLTRLAKRGRFDCTGKQQPVDPRRRVYYYQEDPPGLTKKADADLQNDECSPLPWRRVYGFAVNSQILDRCFLVGSVGVILIWYLAPGNMPHLLKYVDSPPTDYISVSVGIAAILTLFFSGELVRKALGPKLERFARAKYPILAAGLILLGVWSILIAKDVERNVSSVFSNPVAVAMFIVLIPITIFAVVKWKTRRGQIGMI